MGCNGCSTKSANGLPTGCKNNGWCGTGGGCGSKLDSYDWLSNVYYYDDVIRHPLIEVKFKGTRKEYFHNPHGIDLFIGDAVVVESQPSGWDLGSVSLTGDLVKIQMKKNKVSDDMLRNILRLATDADLEKFEEAKNLEFKTMIRARNMAHEQGLVMKISDVEYQGDRTKATFFYTADGRVDFRELIKLMARDFRIKVEMRQIGLRQEAGRLGGIGSCGRELCCSTWLTDFNSVPTTAARYQNLFLNPLKLSGQCGRLKCCLNYELDTYVEALKDFPDDNTIIKTEKGIAKVEKLDILKRIMWFKYADMPTEQRFFALDIEQVKELIELNKDGKFASELEEYSIEDDKAELELDYKDVVGEESLDRFDKNRGQHKSKRRSGNNQNRNQNQARPSFTKPDNISEGNVGQQPKPQQKTQQRPQNTNQPQRNPKQGQPNRNENDAQQQRAQQFKNQQQKPQADGPKPNEGETKAQPKSTFNNPIKSTQKPNNQGNINEGGGNENTAQNDNRPQRPKPRFKPRNNNNNNPPNAN